jgi:hypothetical protein
MNTIRPLAGTMLIAAEKWPLGVASVGGLCCFLLVMVRIKLQ